MPPSRPILLLALLSLLYPATAQNFQDPFTDPAGAFSQYLLHGQDGPWTGRLEPGRYVLENGSDPAAVEYVYVTALPGLAAPLSQHGLSVVVGGDFPDPETSQAGLIVNVDAATRHYYAFTLKGGGVVALALRDEGGFRELASTTTDALRPDRNQLAAVMDGDLLRFLVNGTELMSIESPSMPAGGVGLLAAGRGSFRFEAFAVGALTIQKAAPSKGTP